jgi:hypothetical protein
MPHPACCSRAQRESPAWPTRRSDCCRPLGDSRQRSNSRSHYSRPRACSPGSQRVGRPSPSDPRQAIAPRCSDREIHIHPQRTSANVRKYPRVLTEPSTIADDDLAELRLHGWSDRIIADVVGLVALNQLTGAFNLVAGLEPNETQESTGAATG